jgi:hypothetical protein
MPSPGFRVRLLFALRLALAVAVSTCPIAATALTIDQSFGANPSVFLPIKNVRNAQSFTPALDTLEFVDVRIANMTPTVPSLPDSRGATFDVAIRTGESLANSIIATSRPIDLPGGFGRGTGDPDIVTFRFDAPVSLTPASLHSFEVRYLDGDEGAQFFVLSGIQAGGYPLGQAIGYSGDWWFREGIGPLPPEPSPRCADLQADQCYIPPAWSQGNSIANSKPYQTFAPTLTGLDYVQLQILHVASVFPTEPESTFATFEVLIHAGVRLTDPVIGVSRPVVLPRGFGRPNGGVVTFPFSTTVPLTPDRSHAIEIALIAGDGSPAKFVLLSRCPGDYRRGYAEGGACDFWFREGLGAPTLPPPTGTPTEIPAAAPAGLVALAAALGAAGLAMIARRRSYSAGSNSRHPGFSASTRRNCAGR